MCTSLMPAARAKYSPVIWLAVPAPAEPKLTLSGLAFA
jgi:hypothetical protein